MILKDLDLKRNEIRRRAQTNLYFLATKVLSYDLVPDVHQPVCDHFLKLDPDKPLYELSEVKNRLLLDPRGHFKTTIDICHTLQLILCYPDIRILLVSGTQKLAENMLDEVRRHFIHNEELRLLFPEFAINPTIKEQMGTVYEFTTAARTNWKLREPTLTISTIGSVKAGSHFEYIKYDDVVNENNSESPDQLAKTIYRFHSTVPLLDLPGKGYCDVIGTRYDFSDLYGHTIDGIADEQFVELEIPFGRIIRSETWSIFIRQACTLPLRPDSTILFPFDAKGNTRFTYKTLKKLWKTNPHHFGCQYINDPSFGESSSFPEELLRSALVQAHELPLMRRDPLSGQLYRAAKVFITWDFAFSKKKRACYTVGIVGAWCHEGKLWILDMVRGRFSPDELAFKFLELAKRWYYFLDRIGVEEAGGSQLIGPTLRAGATRMQIGLPIEWLPLEQDKTKDERIFGLLPLLRNGKIKIFAGMPDLEEFIKEFVRFPKYSYRDIPDATSMLLKYQSIADPRPLTMEMNEYPIAFPEQRMTNDMLGYGWVG